MCRRLSQYWFVDAALGFGHWIWEHLYSFGEVKCLQDCSNTIRVGIQVVLQNRQVMVTSLCCCCMCSAGIPRVTIAEIPATSEERWVVVRRRIIEV